MSNVITPTIPLCLPCRLLATGSGVYPRRRASSSTRLLVCGERRFANLARFRMRETAVIDTPASAAMSFKVTLRCASFTSCLVLFRSHLTGHREPAMADGYPSTQTCYSTRLRLLRIFRRSWLSRGKFLANSRRVIDIRQFSGFLRVPGMGILRGRWIEDSQVRRNTLEWLQVRG